MIDIELFKSCIPSEVHNRARRLYFMDDTNPLLSWYYCRPGDADLFGNVSSDKMQAKAQDMIDIYWDWSKGVWQLKPFRLVASMVWRNYLAALSKFAPHSFLPERVQRSMAMERFLKYGLPWPEKPKTPRTLKPHHISVKPVLFGYGNGAKEVRLLVQV